MNITGAAMANYEFRHKPEKNELNELKTWRIVGPSSVKDAPWVLGVMMMHRGSLQWRGSIAHPRRFRISFRFDESKKRNFSHPRSTFEKRPKSKQG